MTMMRAVAWSLVLLGVSLGVLSLILGFVPGLLAAGFCFALGMIVLAVRRPEREEER